MTFQTTELVAEFHKIFERPVPDIPEMIPTSGLERVLLGQFASTLEGMAKAAHIFCEGMEEDSPAMLRVQLMVEELGEFVRALSDDDMVEALDALCDLRYVNDGAVVAMGLQRIFLDAFAEVHRTNMAKLHDGEVVRDEAGRIIKPEGWRGPDLETVLESASWTF